MATRGTRLEAQFVAASAAACLILCSTLTFAAGQLPLQSEDPASPCEGYLETAVAYGLDVVGPGKDQLGEQETRYHVDMAVPEVQFNYGWSDRLQWRVGTAIAATTVSPSGHLEAGFGDSSAGLKYRFMDQIGGPEYDDTCKPRQAKEGGGLAGPVSISIFPQFNFPTGSEEHGLGAGEYSLFLPLDAARRFGDLTVIGEVSFLWRFHDRSEPNDFEFGIAGYYDLTPKWDLLGEQRVVIPTAGTGGTFWLMNIGAEYYFDREFSFFGSVGTSAGASAVADTDFAMLLGATYSIPAGF
jgi:hypothetical protein